MKKILLSGLIAIFVAIGFSSFAEEPKKAEELSLGIIAAKDNQEIFSLLQQAKDIYFKEGKFNEFCVFLEDLEGKKKTLVLFSRYFRGLARFQQLKYLEEKQLWDEYFNKGNDYREEIVSGLDEIFSSGTGKDFLYLYARLLSWQFHQGQQDVFVEESLSNLMSAAKEYAAEDSVDLAPLKEAADNFYSSGQKGKAGELYKLYTQKVVKSAVNDEELSAMAEKFLGEGNLEFAEAVYDAYIDRIAKLDNKEKIVSELIRIAREFAYKDGVVNDPLYSEKIFQKIESLSAKVPFDEQLSYLRAYNLEKAKEFEQAKALYIDLLSRFPESAYQDKINFKLGVISAYVLRDIKTAREYFQKAAGKEITSPEVISSLYHLGLLAQWEEDLERAKANYLKLQEKAGTEFKESLAIAEERLKEVNENKLLEYSTRNFLDVSLRDEYSSFNMSKLELKPSAYNLKKGQQFTVTATAYPPESGCLQVTLEYVWAGDLGGAQPALEDASFTGVYSDPGIKVIGLVVRTSDGVVIDRAVDLIEVE